MSKNDKIEIKTEKTPGQIKREKNLIKFTPMNAKQASEAAARAKLIRKQVRAEILSKLVENLDFGNEMLKAVKSGDVKRIDLIEKAMSIVGITYNQSEDAVNKLQIDATTDNKVDMTSKVQFVLPSVKG